MYRTLSELEFEIHPVNRALAQLIKLDAEIDPSMHLTDEEKYMLASSKGYAVLCFLGDRIVGGSYFVSALEAKDILSTADTDFAPKKHQFYLYSLVLAKEFRTFNLAVSIYEMLVGEARKLGYTEGLAHVRVTKKQLDVACERLCKPYLIRIVENFWPELPEPDVKFMAFKI